MRFLTVLLLFLVWSGGDASKRSWSTREEFWHDFNSTLTRLDETFKHNGDKNKEALLGLFVFSVPTAFSTQVTASCWNDSIVYLQHLLNDTDWASMMLSSSGKLQDILFADTKRSVGHYDDCLQVAGPEIKGKYCTAYVNLGAANLETKMRRLSRLLHYRWSGNGLGANVTKSRDYSQPSISMCIPSSCRAEDFGLSIASALQILVDEQFSVATEEAFCSGSSTSWDLADVAVLCALSVISTLVALGTLCEVFGWTTDCYIIDKVIHFAHCFSLINNVKSLVSNPPMGGSLACINGIRFITMAWVVLGHSWIQGLLQRNENVAGLVRDGLKWQFQVIGNATVSVDTFFLISGTLVSHRLLHQLEASRGKFSLALFYFHRYTRITVIYAVIFAFVCTMLVHLGSGPDWFTVQLMASNCRRVWWQQFLYINNFVPKGADEQCMTETWYLASDYQLFLMSPLLIYPLWRCKKKGLMLLASVILISLAANVAMFCIYLLPPTSMMTRPIMMSKSLVDFWVYYYPQPWFRSPPYLVGIFLGWVLFYSSSSEKNQIQLPRALVMFACFLSCLTCLLIVYGLSPFLDEQHWPTIHPVISVLYGSLHRFAWSCSVAWVVFVCVCGYGNGVNKFLSSTPFVGLGRLSYCTYLVHYNVITVYYSHKRTSSYYTALEQVYTFTGHFCLSLALAFILCVTVEISFLNVEKMICKSHTKSDRKIDDQLATVDDVTISCSKDSPTFVNFVRMM